jgi:hypothetical protein
MTNLPINLVKSILTVVKASGSNVDHDLSLPDGKSIAQLLYDQENKTPENPEESSAP